MLRSKVRLFESGGVLAGEKGRRLLLKQDDEADHSEADRAAQTESHKERVDDRYDACALWPSGVGRLCKCASLKKVVLSILGKVVSRA